MSLLSLPASIHEINIHDFGADPNGKSVSTKSVQAALDAANEQTGMTRVVIPEGTFICGLLHLRSNTELHLESGAVLKSDPDYSSHTYEGKVGGILLARDLENISITGEGEINGNEHVWFHMDRSRTFIDYDVSSIQQGAAFVDFANPFPDGPVEPKQRPGNLLIFSNCRNVQLKDFRIRGASYWTIHMADCVQIEVDHLSIQHDQNIPNNDGIHLTSCRHARLTRLDIASGDDAIALTGFRNLEGEPEIELGFRDMDGELSDIHIEDCRLSSRSSAIRIGYGANQMSDICIRNVKIYDSNRAVLIQARDAGGICDVSFENLKIETRFMAGSWWGNGEPISISAAHRRSMEKPLGSIRNIHFKNIQMRSPSPVLLYAPKAGLVNGVRFENCRLDRITDTLHAHKGNSIDLRPIHDFKQALKNTECPEVYSENAGYSGQIERA